MPQKIWTGSINFGLVAIPVGLYSATESHSIQFNQYVRGTADRVRYRRVNERTGDEVGYSDIVKGREVDGVLVTVEPQELDDIAPHRSQTIDITSFVDLDEIDPVYFQKTYWLAPTGHQHDRPYSLLREAMAATNRAGIATFVMRGREYLTAVRADRDALALNTLFFADEIRDPSTVVGGLTEIPTQNSKELRMASDLIESMSAPWDPQEHEDTYAARVEQLLQDKAQGRSPRPEETPAEPSEVIDLTEALRRSADQARRSRGGSGPRGTSRRGRKQAPAEESESGGTEEVSALSKTELNRRARELDIKGRSKLNRAELEKAVTSAAAHRGQSRRPREVS